MCAKTTQIRDSSHSVWHVLHFLSVSFGKESTTFLNASSAMTPDLLNLAELTIQVLDIFDITEGELKLIIGGKTVCWVHDSSGVRRVGQAKCMSKFMDCYSK